MIKLCKFYGSELLQKCPIYYNGQTYITNGSYALRFAGRLEDAAEVAEDYIEMVTLMESLFPSAAEMAAMRHVPRLIDPVIVTPCKECRGYGITKKCPHCCGEGIVDFERDCYTYECVCKKCNGSCKVLAHMGEAGVERCSSCQGFGDEVDEWYFSQPVHIDKARLSPNQMLILSRLPVIAWAAHGTNGHFIFIGGDGILLGVSTPEED